MTDSRKFIFTEFAKVKRYLWLITDKAVAQHRKLIRERYIKIILTIPLSKLSHTFMIDLRIDHESESKSFHEKFINKSVIIL